MSSNPVQITESNGDSDLDAILELQRVNHRSNVERSVALAEGFVTVRHDREALLRMHALAPSIVAKRGDELVGYALVMPLAARADAPVLDPLFELLDQLQYREKPLAAYRYYVMGQVCVAHTARGQGVFDALYDGHRRYCGPHYDLCVTDISQHNQRSLRAHARVGFVEIHRFSDATDDWSVVALDLRTHTPPR